MANNIVPVAGKIKNITGGGVVDAKAVIFKDPSFNLDTILTELKQKSDSGAFTPKFRINSENYHWEVTYDNETTWVDLEIIALGKDGESHSIEISDDGYWIIDDKKTDVPARAQDGNTPIIEIKEDYWYINNVNTGVRALAQDGKDATPPKVEIIDKYWFIDGVSTDVKAVGEDGVAPTVNIIDDIWYINNESTGIKAVGEDGKPGETPTIEISDDRYWVINGEKTDVLSTVDPVELESKIIEKVTEIEDKIDTVINTKIDTDLNLEEIASGIIEDTVENLKINDNNLDVAANEKMNIKISELVNEDTIDGIIGNSELINNKIESSIDDKITDFDNKFVSSEEYATHVSNFESQLITLNTAIAAASNDTLYLTGEEMAAAVNGEEINEDGEVESEPFEFFKEKYPNSFYIIFCTSTNTNIPKYTGNALYFYTKNSEGKCSFNIMQSSAIQNQGKVTASLGAINVTTGKWPSGGAISTDEFILEPGDISAILTGDLSAFNGKADTFDEDGYLKEAGSGARLSVSGLGITAENTDVNIIKDGDIIKISNKGKITIKARNPIQNTVSISVSVKDDTDRIDYIINNNNRDKSVSFYQPAIITKTVNGVESIYKTFTSENVSSSETFADLEANTTITYYVRSQNLSKYYVTAEGYGTFDFSSKGTTTRKINNVENVSYKYYIINLKAPGTTVLGVK